MLLRPGIAVCSYHSKNNLTTEWLLQLQGASGSPHSCMYIAGITRYLQFPLLLATTESKINHLFLQLHTSASDQLITSC